MARPARPSDTPNAPTPAVSVAGLGKAFGATPVLQDVALALDEGELLAVLGPSGCGKTTLLRCLAGFERIDSGRIALHGRAVALPGVHVPPHRRQVAVVPQEGALFPHLSVAENVGFGLGRAVRRRGPRIQECLELVDLAGFGRRMPHELSGGQQQRVALARALAPRPPLVLLDEPFGALDAALRADLRAQVRRTLHDAGATAILVTHDQAEALSVADRVAVMRGGRIRRLGAPAEVYARPGDAFVARFVGDAALLPLIGTPGDDAVGHTAVGPVRLHPEDARTARPGDLVVVRPEQVSVTGGEGSDHHGVAGVVTAIDYRGHETVVALEADGVALAARMDVSAAPTVGTRVGVALTGPCPIVPGDEA